MGNREDAVHGCRRSQATGIMARRFLGSTIVVDVGLTARPLAVANGNMGTRPVAAGSHHYDSDSQIHA